MPKPATFTDDDYRAACEAILQETGKEPTGETVRNRVGGGSMTRIGPIVSAFKKKIREEEGQGGDSRTRT